MTILNEILTLDDACNRFFDGEIRPSTLRSLAAQGLLKLTRVGRKDFMRTSNLEEMILKCEQQLPAPDSTSTSPGSSGTSETVPPSEALGVVSKIGKALKKH